MVLYVQYSPEVIRHVGHRAPILKVSAGVPREKNGGCVQVQVQDQVQVQVKRPWLTLNLYDRSAGEITRRIPDLGLDDIVVERIEACRGD